MIRRARLDDLQGLWLVLLGLGLLARALVPAGWMPIADAQGIRLILCSGWQEVAPPPSHDSGHNGSGHGHHMAPSHGSGHDTGEQGKKADHGAPCTFAASALNVPIPQQPAVLLAAPVITYLAAAYSLVRVGQGLAAPPPPSTGPPSLS